MLRLCRSSLYGSDSLICANLPALPTAHASRPSAITTPTIRAAIRGRIHESIINTRTAATNSQPPYGNLSKPGWMPLSNEDCGEPNQAMTSRIRTSGPTCRSKGFTSEPSKAFPERCRTSVVVLSSGLADLSNHLAASWKGPCGGPPAVLSIRHPRLPPSATCSVPSGVVMIFANAPGAVSADIA